VRQEEIKTLLLEASEQQCTLFRLIEIQKEFLDACFPEGSTDEGPECGIRLLVGQLFVEITDKRREILPTLFPFFAIACGDRNGINLTAEKINWGLV